MASLNYDPKLPVYAAPKTSFSNVAAATVAPPSQVVEKDTATVAGQMKGLMAAGGDYMKAAEAKSMRASNKRGLLNSGIAAGEGANAAIQSALPIATADAKTYSDLTAQNNQTANTANLNNQTAGLEYGKSVTNAALNGALAQQTIAGTLEGKKMDVASAANLADIDANTKLKTTEMGTQSSERIAAQELANKIALEQSRVASAEKITAMTEANKVKIQEMVNAADLNKTTIDAANKLEIQKLATSSAETIAGLDNATKVRLEQMGILSKEQIAAAENETAIKTQQIAADTSLGVANVNAGSNLAVAGLEGETSSLSKG